MVGWRTFRLVLWPALLLFAITLNGLVGCTRVAPVLKIGLVAPFEGRYRSVGYDAIYAARLGIREVNEAGGIGRYRIALVALDDSGDPEFAREAATSLVLDRDVVAVLGHWLTPTTAAARPVYAQGGLPLVAVGEAPLEASDPSELPAAFRARYAAVTPFDEVAGPHAGATYDALQLIFDALEIAEANGEITRAGVATALDGLQYQGLTGTVYQP